MHLSRLQYYQQCRIHYNAEQKNHKKVYQNNLLIMKKSRLSKNIFNNFLVKSQITFNDVVIIGKQTDYSTKFMFLQPWDLLVYELNSAKSYANYLHFQKYSTYILGTAVAVSITREYIPKQKKSSNFMKLNNFLSDTNSQQKYSTYIFGTAIVIWVTRDYILKQKKSSNFMKLNNFFGDTNSHCHARAE